MTTDTAGTGCLYIVSPRRARYPAPVQTLVSDLDGAVLELEAALAGGDLGASVRQMLPLMRRLADAAAAIDSERARHEGMQEQFSAQRDLILALGCPILQVRSDVLCVPLLGPYDMDRAAQLRDAVLEAVSRTRARLVLLDLTGALVPEATSAAHILELCRAIRLLGARAALSGIGPALAQILAELDEGVGRITTFMSLETALNAAPR
jgi:rsbT co-antagonist protein RsbR